jgi:hypothetical protein
MSSNYRVKKISFQNLYLNKNDFLTRIKKKPPPFYGDGFKVFVINSNLYLDKNISVVFPSGGRIDSS